MFWRADNARNIVSEWFSKFKYIVTSVENNKCLKLPLINKTDGSLD
jgi:hypothetical protein